MLLKMLKEKRKVNFFQKERRLKVDEFIYEMEENQKVVGLIVEDSENFRIIISPQCSTFFKMPS